MSRVPAKTVKPGMILEKDVEDRTGRTLLRSGIVLEEKHLRILQTWGVSHLDARDPNQIPDDTAPVTLELTEPQRQEVARRLDHLFRHAGTSQPFVAELRRLAEPRVARAVAARS